MRTIIAGSRSIDEMPILWRAMAACRWGSEITSVLSGGARGADRLGERWGVAAGLLVKCFPALWDKLGPGAGYVRNIEMAENADALIALWDGQSGGTRHMIGEALKKGLRVFIWNTTTNSPMDIGKLPNYPSLF